MTKKLFVVLIVVVALLLTISLAMAAKKILKGTPETYEPRKFMEQQSATSMPHVEFTEQQTTTSLYGGHGNKGTATSTASGTLAGQINVPGGKDFCDLYGTPAFYITDWLYGLEWYANYQDPQEHGCVSVFPFLVDVVGFDIVVEAAISIDVQGFVLDADWTDPDCPVPGAVLCETPTYTVDIPYDGWWTIGLPLQDPCCMNFPYFAGIYIHTDLYGLGADAVAEDDPTDICRSYNDYGYGWEDLVAIYGWPGQMTLWSTGWTEPQNDCGCCQFPDSCSCWPLDNETDCVNAGGTWFEGYVCIGTECQPYGEPDPEGCCEFADSCEDGMTEADCMAAGGTDWFDYATNPDIECINNEDCGIPIDTTCELMNDNGGAASYGSMFDVGDQNATYLDPGVLCDCDPVYPLRIEKVKAYIYDYAGAGQVDVIVHFYDVGGALCDGPGAAFYSFGPVTVTDFYPAGWAEIVLPEVLCVDGPFFLALEYASGSVGSIPCILFDNNAPVDTCYQWNDYQDYGWIEWWDFWSTPADVGWLMLRAVGVCNSGACPIACNLIQDVGEIAYYFGSWAAGDAIGKYFDPEVYCEPEVYPYKIHDVELVLYDYAGLGTIDIIVDVHVVCQDTCDGPGTQIYKSDPITVTDMYPAMAHIVLPEQVCVFEPFFLSIEYATGEQGSTPSLVWASESYPCDSCHVWMYWASGGYPYWVEWNDFWSPPAGGCPILRVTGFTNHPDCDFAPCDTTLDTLMGATYPYYYWRNPSTYGDRYLNERFDMPLAGAGGRLDEIQIAFYDAGTGAMGTPDPEIYVWLSDGLYPIDNNPPYQAIAQFNMAYGDIVWFSGMNVIQTHELGMMFDAGESFHIGYGHAYIDGDTLCTLSDDGYYVSDRSVEWLGTEWGTFLDDWGLGIDLLIHAVICPNELSESTFTVSCSPFMNYATPGDPPAVLFQVDVGSLIGYNLNVDLDCTPPTGINVSFNPDNVPAPYTSDVTVSVDPGVTYDDYTLTFCGTGADGQGPKCCDVTLRIQPPYDECLVDFYHGKQRISNFGAVGDHNNSGQSFLWYGITDLLFDGTFIIATDVDHMALDFGRTHEHWDFVPVDYMNCYYEPKWPANIGYADFYSQENIPGEHDSVYVIGIMDECADFSIKIKIYYNDGPDPITDMYLAVFEDWDFGDAYNNWGDLDYDHNLVWMYEPLDETMLCGLFKAPFYDDPMRNVQIVHNAYITWPNDGYGLDPDSIWRLLTFEGTQGATTVGADSQDFSVMITPQPITLAPGDAHIEVWIDFCRDTDVDNLTWSQWWHRVLRYAGFYRGDVNASDTLELPALDVSDLVYLIQYLFSDGPDPKPYVDQGDVNADMKVDVGDVVYLLNYVFHPGQAPPPIDYVRFIPSMWPRESLFENSNWH